MPTPVKQNGNGNTPRWLTLLCVACTAVATATFVLVSSSMGAVARNEVDRTAYPKLAGEKLEEALHEISASQKTMDARLQLIALDVKAINTKLEERNRE